MAYRETDTKIIFNLIDETAKSDCTYDVTNSPIKSGCDITKLSGASASSENYITNELNYSILDSSLPDFTSYSNYAFISDFISNSNCTFDNEYYLKITFTKPHTTIGITATFDGDYIPDSVRINYYDSTGIDHTLLSSKEFTVDSNTFFFDNNGVIENFKEIRMYFLSTKYPNSLIKMSRIEYGANLVLGSSDLLNAEIHEETDIISNNLSMDTCRFTVYKDSDDFNIDNPKSIYLALKKNQKIEVYEYIYLYDDLGRLIETKEIFMGVYYLKEWKSNTKHTISFECVDLIGLLDDIKIEFARNITDILSVLVDISASVDNYLGTEERYFYIDDDISLDSNTLKVAMPFCTCREALQMACFAISATASCSRRRYIYISIKDNLISHNIEDERNFGCLTSTLNPEVTGIQYNEDIRLAPKTKDGAYVVETLIEIQNIGIGNNQKILIPDKYIFWVYDSSEHRYIAPYIDTDESTAIATIDYTSIYLHLIYVNVTSPGKLVIKGCTYDVIKNTNIKKFDDNTNNFVNIIDISGTNIIKTSLFNDDRGDITDILLDYYSKRNTCEYEFLVTDERTGNWCLFKNMYGNTVKGNLYSMDINLTGGFTAKAKFVCCEILSEERYFYMCGNDLISGDDIGID